VHVKKKRESTDYQGKREKILVVDDIKDQREIVSFLLTNLGYTVDTVSSGEEAINYIKKGTPDLILLDMIMDPGIDGLETFKRIIKIKPGMKVIIASGYSETRRVREALRLGAGKYIKKPFTMKKLGIEIRTMLDK
jgi:DNA-binding NtrC family response regulator